MAKIKTILLEGGSPDVVVMGGDSCTRGCEFEFLHWILDGHFSHLIVVKIFLLEKTEIKQKGAGIWPNKKPYCSHKSGEHFWRNSN